MSDLTPKADIAEREWDVRFVPKADSCNAAILSLFDYLVGADKQQKRRVNSVDKNLKFDAVQQF